MIISQASFYGLKNIIGGKNQNMEIKANSKSVIISNSAQRPVHKNIYIFQIKDRRVKVVFSDNPNIQTIENALVKIAIRRIT